jgi:hypothetical protein
MIAFSSMPFCPGDGRWVNPWYLSAVCRYTAYYCIQLKCPVFPVNIFHFFWFFSVTMSMRKLLIAFSSERPTFKESG